MVKGIREHCNSQQYHKIDQHMRVNIVYCVTCISKLLTMKKILVAATIFLVIGKANAQQVQACTANDIMGRTLSADTVYVFNFWATWCGPCVGELPEFNKLYDRYAGKPVKIMLVSLDFKQDYPAKLQRFVEKKKLKPQVLWLSDTDPNVFMPKIDDTWQGSIPATLIMSPGKKLKQFLEGSVKAKQLAPIIDHYL
jgi:thiol-disulfide isomerase/thioredoxin